MAGEEDEECLVEEREMRMVALTGSGNPIQRMGWFLNPTASFSNDCLDSTFPPARRKPAYPRRIPKVLFKGWGIPQPKWGRWVDKLRPMYNSVWKKVGIFYSIQASTYNISRDPASICAAVLQFWCPETNTFFFPWSEATVTLEDVMILGGFPMLGEPVGGMGPLAGDLAEMESRMVAERIKLVRGSSKRAGHASWMNHFIGREGDQLEHVAFLSLWLSKYVFPGPPLRTIGRYVFPIAVRLAQGSRIALAPAVLASLYRDFRALKEHLVRNRSLRASASSFVVWAPFSIVQIWLWERFIALRPETCPNSVHCDEPRAARWQNLFVKTELSSLMVVFESPDEFQWRPYTASLDNWRRPSFYKDNGELVCGNSAGDEELESFERCSRVCELVGLDCIEQYLPHRVAMQFGLDQDLPGCVPRANLTWELAWATYDKPAKNAVFYVPPRLFESDVTLRYRHRWNLYMLACNGAERSLVRRESFSKNAKKMLKNKMSEKQRQKVLFPPSSKKRRLHEVYNITHELHKTCTEEIKQCSDAKEQIREVERREVGETSTCDPLDENKGIMEDVKRMDARESVYSSVITEEEDVTTTEKTKFKRKVTEESTRLRREESDQEMQIRKLMEEIAALEAEIMDLESLVVVNSKPKLFPS